MKKKMKRFLIERLTRINFIKTELNQLVGNSFFKNRYINLNYNLSKFISPYHSKSKMYSISFFRLYGMFDFSPKLVNKKYRLSRFSFNREAQNGKISGLTKRGW